MGKIYVKCISKINTFICYVISICLAIMSITIVLQVIFRIMHQSLPWSEELTRYLMIYLVFLGAPIALYDDKHMTVEIIKMMIPSQIKKQYLYSIYLLICVFFGVVTFYSIQMILMSSSQLSPALQIPIRLVYLSIPICGILMIINSIAYMIRTYEQEGVVEK